MESIAELLRKKGLGGRYPGKSSFEGLSPLEIARKQAERQNAEPGKLNLDDGYDCKLCMNRGYTIAVDQGANGCVYTRCVPCKCSTIRASIHRLRQSGLEKSVREQTFDRFVVKEPWQQAMVDTAKRYLAEGEPEGRWFYAGGQPGCGKTHICTAIARELLYKKPVLYVVWEQAAKRIKAVVNEADEYAEEIARLERAEVLYIDDLFKPVLDDSGRRRPPTPADIRLAFEVLNYRYINRMPTILSSEWYLTEIIDMDEATGSRIAERSNGFQLTLGRDKAKNHRLKAETIL